MNALSMKTTIAKQSPIYMPAPVTFRHWMGVMKEVCTPYRSQDSACH